MKARVSIPDEVFVRAEKMARQTGRSRSAVYAAALKEHLDRHGSDEVTATMNRVCDAVGDERDGFTTAAARQVLERSEW